MSLSPLHCYRSFSSQEQLSEYFRCTRVRRGYAQSPGSSNLTARKRLIWPSFDDQGSPGFYEPGSWNQGFNPPLLVYS